MSSTLDNVQYSYASSSIVATQENAIRIPKMASRLSSTPCPIPRSLNQLLNTDTDETTTTIDFTTEVRASFRNARPRRTQRQSVQFHIHEEDDQKGSSVPNPRVSLLQPPRRAQVLEGNRNTARKVHVSHTSAAENISHEHNNQHSQISSKISQAPKRPTSRLSVLPESAVKQRSNQPLSPVTEILRQPRRGTIFIPNDDTTMPSMYMGIFSPIKDIDLHSNADDKLASRSELTGIAAQMAMKRMGKKSILGAQARRGPLQPSLRIVQESTTTDDKFGQGGGKENVPPKAVDKDKTGQAPKSTINRSSAMRASFASRSVVNVDNQSLYAPTASSVLKRETITEPILHASKTKPAWNGGARLRQSTPVPIAHIHKSAPPPPNISVSLKPRVPTRFVLPAIHTDSASQDYAILQADLVHPALYEENWLQHQEIAITQLVNNLFSACRIDSDQEHQPLRDKLLEFYNSPAVLLMHTRLQAALLYGALGIPQDTLEQGARLQKDIGLRKHFTDLWLGTYEASALESALAVVIGRECRSHNIHVSASSLAASRVSKSGLRTFIETFLIRNEDSKPDLNNKDRTAWGYQRTVLRSLMLIKVLDSVKSERPMRLKGDLFLRSSPLKSSVAVVQALMQMLNPAAGDPIRNLGHIDYRVSHIQHPLEEYQYCIENIAVDLRDGVRLTRLVELLLYPSTSTMLDKQSDSETTTILMPEGETVEFSDNQDWPLSQHIKMPCQSRVVKIWNVQLALSAIRNVKGIGALVDGITAEDIVDGFREKTIRLLWALVGKCGLSSLINWQDLRWEIRRLENKPGLPCSEEFYEDEFEEERYSFEVCKGLLRRWAHAVTTSRDIEIRNFTTSFADGKAFEAIVDEYEPYLQAGLDGHTSKTLSLRDRLGRLGCSNQFSELFIEPRQTHIFDRDFVLAALAFLCSRLLAPSRRNRAATVIQGAWRKYWSKIEAGRREERKKVAMACASLIHSKKEQSKTSLTSRCNPTIATTRTSLGQYPGPVSLASSGGPISPNSEADIWLTL